MRNFYSLIILLLGSISFATAQKTGEYAYHNVAELEQAYLMMLSQSSFGTDVGLRSSTLFWSLCLGDSSELSHDKMEERVTALQTDTLARRKFYQRINYYISPVKKSSYYSGMLGINHIDSVSTAVVEEFVEYIQALGEDSLLSAKWSRNYSGNNVIPGSEGYEENRGAFMIVEQMPSFPGGDEAMIRFITKYVEYPLMERDNDIRGTVYLQFIITETGEVCAGKVIRGVSPGLDREGLRVLKMMPRWEHGKQNGKAVPVMFTLPIKFMLQ